MDGSNRIEPLANRGVPGAAHYTVHPALCAVQPGVPEQTMGRPVASRRQRIVISPDSRPHESPLGIHCNPPASRGNRPVGANRPTAPPGADRQMPTDRRGGGSRAGAPRMGFLTAPRTCLGRRSADGRGSGSRTAGTDWTRTGESATAVGLGRVRSRLLRDTGRSREPAGARHGT
jgi:hypothetical protein